MADSENLKIIVQSFDEAQSILRAHIELSAGAADTIGRLDRLFAGQELAWAIERTRLRSLRESLTSPDASPMQP